MSDTKIELLQSADETNRKNNLVDLSHKDLIAVVYENVTAEEAIEFKKDLINFIIDNNLDLR